MSDYDPNAPKEGLEPTFRATVGAVRELLSVVADMSDDATKERLQRHAKNISDELMKIPGGGWGYLGGKG